MKYGRKDFSRWFTMHLLRPEICPSCIFVVLLHSEDILPVLRVSRYYLFARPAMYFRLRERKLVPEWNGTSKPAWLVVTTSNVTWVHIECSLILAARYPFKLNLGSRELLRRFLDCWDSRKSRRYFMSSAI